MIQEIPIPQVSTPSKRFKVQLDGALWTFDLTWQERTDRIRLTLTKPNGEHLFTGRKIVCGVDLLERYPDDNKPRGRLFAVAMGSDLAPPRRGELGARIRLYYATEDP